MFAARRLFRSNKQLTNYICTSSVLQCDKGKKVSNLFRRDRKLRKVGETQAKDDQINVSVMTADLRPKKRERREWKSDMSRLMASSVVDVAREMGGNEEQIKRDLMEYVKMLDAAKEPEIVPENVEGGIKPRKLGPRDWLEATRTPKEILERETGRERKRTEKLGIFRKNIMTKEYEVNLKIWDTLGEEELAAKSKRTPDNYYEELINWTNEGRLWRFPIDNDQGMDREAETSFAEHVFLDKHLEPWCPKRGPIRKFMEVVLIGLGKNPYLTPKEKIAHIMWFKNYFEEKKKLLQELGAMGPAKLEEVSSQESKS